MCVCGCVSQSGVFIFSFFEEDVVLRHCAESSFFFATVCVLRRVEFKDSFAALKGIRRVVFKHSFAARVFMSRVFLKSLIAFWAGVRGLIKSRVGCSE